MYMYLKSFSPGQVLMNKTVKKKVSKCSSAQLFKMNHLLIFVFFNSVCDILLIKFIITKIFYHDRNDCFDTDNLLQYY